MDFFVDTTSTAFILAPLEKINLTDWLFTLTDAEYQACSTAHIAAGSSLTQNGKQMSLNVERIGDSLLVQHYIEDISEKDHCRVNSISDSLSNGRWTKIGVTWELSLQKHSDQVCQFHNRIIVWPTDELLEGFKAAGLTNLEPVKARMIENTKAHNEQETPLFAKDIENKVRAGRWNR